VALSERMTGLHSTDPVMRKRTIYTLAAFGPKAKGALPELLKTLTDEPSNLWEDAAVAVGRMGEPARIALERMVKEKKPSDKSKEYAWIENRKRAATALGYAGPAAIPTLRGMLTDTLPSVADSARKALARVAAENPETIPDLARVVGSSAEIVAAAKRSAEVRRLWLSVLDDPDAQARATATEVLGEAGVLDPRMIPSLAQKTGSSGVRIDYLGDRLLRIHRCGHSIVPEVMAQWRASRGPNTRANNHACLQLLIEVGADADSLVPEFLERLRADPDLSDEYDACLFLSAAEKRRAAGISRRPIDGGVADPPSLIPDFLDRLCAVPGGERQRSSSAYGALNDNFDQACPYLLAALRDGPPTRRETVLDYLLSHYLENYKGNRNTLFEDSPNVGGPVPAEIVWTVTALLDRPETRLRSIRLLGEMGSPARSAIPRLLECLDENNLGDIVTAVEHMNVVDPTQVDRFVQVRTGFANNPKRAVLVEELVTLLAKPEPRREYPSAMILLLLHESVDEVIAFLQKQTEGHRELPWRARHFLNSIAGCDPVIFSRLLEIRDYYLIENLLDNVPKRGPESERVAPAILILLQSDRFRSWYQIANALAVACEHKTPPEVPAALSRYLTGEKLSPNEQASLLRGLALMAPFPERIALPETLHKAEHPSLRNFAAAAALRWNPKDAAARRTVLEWAASVPSEKNAARFDRAAVAALAPLAPNDPEALVALVQFLGKCSIRDRDPLEENGQFTLQAILACGGDGVHALEKEFIASGYEYLAFVLKRLAAEGQVSLPAVFAEARRAGQSFASLRALTTNEVARDLLDMVVEREDCRIQCPIDTFVLDQPEPGKSRTAFLRWPSVLPKLRRWLSEKTGPRAELAFDILSRTHPEEPGVWDVVVRRAIDPGLAGDRSTELAIWDAGEKGLAVLRVQLDLPHEWFRSRTPEVLRQLLEHLPDQFTDKMLLDPDVRVRAAAVFAVARRTGRLPWERTVPAEIAPLFRRLARVLSEDADFSVRNGAWSGLEDITNRWPARAIELLEELPSTQRDAWLRHACALFQRNAKDVLPSLIRWIELLDMRDTPELRGLRDELEQLWPPPKAREGNRLSPEELIRAFLKASTWEEMTKLDYGLQRRQLRLEMLARASTEREIVDGLVGVLVTGSYGSASYTIKDRRIVSTIRQLGPTALPVLLKYLDLVDRPGEKDMPARVVHGQKDVIELIGALGPEASEAVELLLVQAGDPRYERRQAAREALRKIAPTVAAEIE
jgi:hypothetical protein